jgi:hypothetical protein
MTRPWGESSYKRLSKNERGETSGGRNNQRNLTAKDSIADIAAEVENARQWSVVKLAQAMMLTKMVHATLHKDLQLSKKSARWMTKMVYNEMKKD